MMRAIVYRDFGSPDVLKAEDVEKPTPAGDEVLVAVRAASVNMFDWYMVQGKPALLRLALGLATPKPLGVDLSGIVICSMDGSSHRVSKRVCIAMRGQLAGERAFRK
jgi:NADPH:quinone reductase-like Zn-dependent oxidoreductase